MTDRHILSWIAEVQDVNIDVTLQIMRPRKDIIISAFLESIIFEGISCKRIFTL
jgi:hypothetical protein